MSLPQGMVTVDGDQLTIDPSGFEGAFEVTVSATDGVVVVEDTFAVTVTNHPPVWTPVGDQEMTHNESPRTLTLLAPDDDGDPITYGVVSVQQGVSNAAYALKERLGLISHATWWDNATERWLGGAGGAWFILKPDGEVYRWRGGLEGQVAPECFIDPQLLLFAEEIDPVSLPQGMVTVLGDQLTIDPADGFEGEFTVEVMATDGIASITDIFGVTVQ